MHKSKSQLFPVGARDSVISYLQIQSHFAASSATCVSSRTSYLFETSYPLPVYFVMPLSAPRFIVNKSIIDECYVVVL